MSSLIKTFYNNKLYHETFPKKTKFNPTEVRFTKVLTKYSTEYNNYLFIQNLCFMLSMDQKDLFTFFHSLREEKTEEEIYKLCHYTNLQPLWAEDNLKKSNKI